MDTHKKKINVFLAYGEIRGRWILLKIDLAKLIHFEFKMLQKLQICLPSLSHQFVSLPSNLEYFFFKSFLRIIVILKIV